jgi:hypothetical protein
MFSGLAQVLATAGVGTYKPTAAYGPTDTAIVSQVLPQAPDAAIGITFYPVSDDATLSDSVVGVQVMIRAAGSDDSATNTLADAVFGVFQSLPDQTLPGGIQVQIMTRKSGTLLGKDDEQRWMRSENYYAQVYRPATHRL